MFLLRYSDPKDRIFNRFNRVILNISVVLGETTLTISDSIETGSPVESEIVKTVSLRTTEITEVIRLRKTAKKKPVFRVRIPYPVPNKPWFLRVCCRSLFKTMWEKEKLS